MKGTLKRMALMFVVLGLSLSTYARPADEKARAKDGQGQTNDRRVFAGEGGRIRK